MLAPLCFVSFVALEDGYRLEAVDRTVGSSEDTCNRVVLCFDVAKDAEGCHGVRCVWARNLNVALLGRQIGVGRNDVSILTWPFPFL